MNMKTCPECGSKKLGWEGKYLICKICGLVLDEAVYAGERILV